MGVYTVGSVCSGIEAASVAWSPLGFQFCWFSEIAAFPSRILSNRYPFVPNVGDMNGIPQKILDYEIEAPDVICGGTPCQAFSLAGWKKGLRDERANPTLRFVDIIEANDKIRVKLGKRPSIVMWENVEGVLNDRTNAFGSLVSSLSGSSEKLNLKKWPFAGILRGPRRTVAWRVLDAKFFGIPQQRRRLYLLAADPEFGIEGVLFDKFREPAASENSYPESFEQFEKDGHKFEIFRSYSDCLYSSYGTKWNGNAAAYNGSLFILQDGRLRRFSPLECERLMGLPDNYTKCENAKKTSRYQAIGNSWAVPVIEWLGKRLLHERDTLNSQLPSNSLLALCRRSEFFDLSDRNALLHEKCGLNSSSRPEKAIIGEMQQIVSSVVPADIYISPVGCHGILRRKSERSLRINRHLEKVLIKISSEMSDDEIEKRSLKQRRGKYGTPPRCGYNSPAHEKSDNVQLKLDIFSE